ncbi:YfiT family bacillithiol transferase [Bacillus sp. JCM 19041]|uniref:YfiT family bacillithiol transferase n=1 Tax=Bacillus sp. JCM 19041 TaxID=1460637 RepID=UPI000B30C9CA
MEHLRFPIGTFDWNKLLTENEVQEWIESIKTFPARLRAVVENMPESLCEQSYREGGWTVRQLVHHLADSHMQSFSRFKFALSEERPTIKPYSEQLWAELPDASAPIEPSLSIIEGLHARWVLLLESLTKAELKRAFIIR